MGGVLLAANGQASEVASVSKFTKQAQGDFGLPVILANTATCSPTGPAAAAAAGPTNLTLSENRLKITLACAAENAQAVPKDLTEVCQEQITGVREAGEKCKIGEKTSGKPVSLASVLAAGSEATWQPNASREGNPGHSWTLSLRKEELPLVDKSFYVGCVKSPDGGASQCKVTVDVLARRSSAENNIVTCAYGANSNDAVVSVEMTQKHNTLKIVCGKEGAVHQNDYASKYCENGDMKECTKPYSDIISNFVETWWTKVDDKDNSVKLTIPPTEFPTQDQSFYFGCARTEGNAQQAGGSLEAQAASGEQEAKTKTCKVLVTVKASDSSLSGGPLLGMTAAASGVAVLAGLVAGTL
ncbi:SAG-related sequence [Besnoitia besnoiti]|uniref:SAG-related sequence n=1 Tax=Besnoitia besnoiti TaxID=94643 RepID=A0A2A9MCB8_BESBE|nr:SAG-related sequence [Besnoitia besnoiti]PFH35625.1 SAG-related sequence [Besnoitia besnoiti]